MGDILFWAAAVAMMLAVTAIMMRGQRRHAGAAMAAAAAADLGVYRDQLREVERDLTRGTIAADEAARLRVEIGRRVLAADRALHGATTTATTGGPGQGATLAFVALALLAIGLGSYLARGAPGQADLPIAERIAMADAARAARPGQAEMEAAVAALPAMPHAQPQDPAHLELVERLRKVMADRPDDLPGQELLARNEAMLGNFPAAARAMDRVIALKGAAADAADHAAHAEILIVAAGGRISPEADAALAAALKLDPRNGLARYYSGLMLIQTGRYDLAFNAWAPLWTQSRSTDPWVPALAEQLPDLAWAAGQHRFQLSPLRDGGPVDGAGGAMGGLDPDTIAAVSELPAEERAELIRSMVDGLLERLATEGGGAAEWARAIGALAVLGEGDRARAILTEAQAVFADRADDLATIDAAARNAGLTE